MALRKAEPRGREVLLFARNFVKHPKMLGSLIPSSTFLISKVLRQVDWRRARVIVEYGPGVGTITRPILRRLSPDARLVVIETNNDFVEFLRSSLSDPRLEVVHGSAADVGAVLEQLGLPAADYIISGIPFSTMPPELRESIVSATHAALQPDGAFLVYQFSSKVLPEMQRRFEAVDVEFEARNIPPMRLFFGRKQHRQLERHRDTQG